MIDESVFIRFNAVAFRNWNSDPQKPQLPEDAGAAVENAMRQLSFIIHTVNKRWWIDPETGNPVERNVGEVLMLAVTELSEALEAHRKNLMDDKLPHRRGLEVELADALIRVIDAAAGMELDLAGAVAEKLMYNCTRKDHTAESRLSADGKKY